MNEHIIYKGALNSLKYSFEDFGVSKTFKYSGDPNNFTRTYKSQLGNLIKLAFEEEVNSSSKNLTSFNKSIVVNIDNVTINVDGNIGINTFPRIIEDLDSYAKSAYKFFLFVNYPMFFGVQNMNSKEFNAIKKAKKSNTHRGKITLDGFDIWYNAIGGDSFLEWFQHMLYVYSGMSNIEVGIDKNDAKKVLELIYAHNFIIDNYKDMDIPKLKLFFDVENFRYIKNESGLLINGSSIPRYNSDSLNEMNLDYAIRNSGEIPYSDPNFGYHIHESFNYDLVLNTASMKCRKIDYSYYGFQNPSPKMGIGYKNLIRNSKLDYYESDFPREYSESPLLQKLFTLAVIALNYGMLDKTSKDFYAECSLRYYNNFVNNISCKNFYIARGNFGQYKNRQFVSSSGESPANLSWDNKFYDTSLLAFTENEAPKFFIVNKNEDVQIAVSKVSNFYNSIIIRRKDYLNPDKLTSIIKSRVKEIIDEVR